MYFQGSLRSIEILREPPPAEDDRVDPNQEQPAVDSDTNAEEIDANRQ